ncbi:MAG: hypothetical protein RLY87_2534 [Chloroflexota bacterium]|jgi:hypothetical protein
MKTMTCAQLGGACDLTFHAESFDDMAKQSQAHGRQMYADQDAAHIQAMEAMAAMMQNPAAMIAWMDEKKQLFDALPNT